MRTIISLFILLLINSSYSQVVINSENDPKIRQQDSINYAVKKQLFCDALANDSNVKINSPWNFYTFHVLSCKGNRSSQEVELIIIAEQSHLNQRMQYKFNQSTAIDGLGKALKIGYASNGPHSIYTNVPVQISITIQGVIPGTEKIGHVGLFISSKDVTISSLAADYKTLEFRNISIKW